MRTFSLLALIISKVLGIGVSAYANDEINLNRSHARELCQLFFDQVDQINEQLAEGNVDILSQIESFLVLYFGRNESSEMMEKLYLHEEYDEIANEFTLLVNPLRILLENLLSQKLGSSVASKRIYDSIPVIQHFISEYQLRHRVAEIAAMQLKDQAQVNAESIAKANNLIKMYHLFIGNQTLFSELRDVKYGIYVAAATNAQVERIGLNYFIQRLDRNIYLKSINNFSEAQSYATLRLLFNFLIMSPTPPINLRLDSIITQLEYMQLEDFKEPRLSVLAAAILSIISRGSHFSALLPPDFNQSREQLHRAFFDARKYVESLIDL